MKELSVIISCRNEVIGTMITLRSALEEFKSGIDGEVVICDNSDDKAYMRSIRGKFRRSEWVNDGNVIFLGQSTPCIFTARELAIRHASGEYIIVVDSHCLFGKNSLREMLKLASKNNGLTYGLMNFSRDHETDAFCDRDIEDFLGIRLFKYSHKKEDVFEVPFRGMPFMCKKEFFNTIGGYGTLAKYSLSWGGGDFILGMKSSMLGYTNLMTKKATVIHLGPFKQSRYFPLSFIREDGRGYPKRFGMILAAYIVGGEDLLTRRISQLTERLGFEQLTGEDIDKVHQMGAEERNWLSERSVFAYEDLVKKFSKLQIRSNSSSIGRDRLPIAREMLISKAAPFIKNVRKKKIKITKPFNWRMRIADSDAEVII